MLGLTIRNNHSEGTTPLYTRLKVEGKSIWVNLRLFVDIKKWNEVSESDKKRTNYLDRLNHSKKLSEIEYGIKDLRFRHNLTKETLLNLIDNVVLSETREQLIQDVNLQTEVEDRKRKDVKTCVKK